MRSTTASKSNLNSNLNPRRTNNSTSSSSSTSTSSSSSSSSLWSQLYSFLMLDKPVVLSLVVLIVLYTCVIVATYQKVQDVEEYDVQFESLRTTMKRMGEDNQNKNKQEDHSNEITSIDQLQHTFPIHVGNDTQVIPHPGLTLSDNIQAIHKAGFDTAAKLNLTVPQFFDISHGHVYGGYDSHGHGHSHASIRSYLGSGQRLMTPAEAASIGSFVQSSSSSTSNSDNNSDNTRLNTIYCSVASYRDPECTATVEDLYARAAHPERIRVAILDQRVAGDPICSQPAAPCDQDPNQALCRYAHLIDVYEMDARLAVGPVFARHLAARHYRGEYFAMQLDSHVRMTADWDDDIIRQWKSANNEMAVLSTYVSDVNGRIDPVTHKRTEKGRPIMCVAEFEGRGGTRHLRFGQQPEGPAGIHGQPTLHPFWAAGFSFARGHFIIQVPYDQYLPMIFQGEEISMTLRGFSYGYDYYAPENGVCFHMYAVKQNEAARLKVPLFWENVDLYRGAGLRGMKRLNSLIGLIQYPANQWPQQDKELYGLGHIRDTAQFFETFGIHTANETLEGHLCRFVGKPMMQVFLPALRKNRMGLDWSKIDYTFVDPNPEVSKKLKQQHH